MTALLNYRTTCPLLRQIDDESWAQMQSGLQITRHAFGELIAEIHSPVESLSWVVAGRVRLLAERDDQEVAVASLKPGDVFGESVLGANARHSLKVRSSTTVEVAHLPRAAVQSVLGRHPSLRVELEQLACLRRRLALLRQSPDFAELPDKVLNELAAQLGDRSFRKGEFLSRQGDTGGPMTILCEGRVRVFITEGRKVQDMAFYREGEFFGERAALLNAPRAATAEALTNGLALELAPAAMHELMRSSTEFRALIERRQKPYEAKLAARMPLDFFEPVKPEESDDKKPKVVSDPFADDDGHFIKRKRPLRGIEHVQQIDEMDCGAASLGMICRYYGRSVSLARIRQLCHTEADGTGLHALCHAATELGLAARAVKCSRRNLDAMPLPAIVHWESKHWIVLYEVKAKHVRVDDPSLGKRKLPRAEFEQNWSGFAALFDYTTSFENAPETRSTLRWLWPFISEHLGTLRLVMMLALIGTFLQLLFPVFTQVVMDKVIVEANESLLKVVLCAMGATLLFMQAGNLIQQYLLAFTTVRLDAAILDFLTRALLALPMSYFTSRRTGDIQRRLDGARQVREFAVQHGVSGVLSCITFCGALALMVIYNPKLAGVFMLTAPLHVLIMRLSVTRLRPLFSDIAEAEGKYASHQIDAIKAMESVKAAGAETAFRDAMLNEFLGVSRKLFRANFMLMAMDSAIQTISLLATSLFLWFGATMVMRSEITVGTFVAFSSISAMASAALLRMLVIWGQSQHVAVLLNRMNDIFEAEPEQGRDRSKLAPVPALQGHVELRKLGFRYGPPGAPEILRDLNLTFSPGTMTAIVGRSGSGKTTMIKLLSGLIEPTQGAVFLDHNDLRLLNYREVRRKVGMVLQETRLFSDSIAKNIAFGEHEPDMERVIACAQMANAHDFISALPLGYETIVGESGMGLSGGQKQRIAIARALYFDPPILIFDEATSALDTESERAIQENLERIIAGRTCIVIAHRLSTIRNADRIVVMEQGEVIENGTHAELMDRRGLYWHLSSQQGID